MTPARRAELERLASAPAFAVGIPEMREALAEVDRLTAENTELRERDRTLSRQIERRANGKDEGSAELLAENAQLAAHRDRLTARWEALKAWLVACLAQTVERNSREAAETVQTEMMRLERLP